MAGIFAQTVVFGSTYSGSAMAQDLKEGIIDRFRTLPMSPSAVLIGRTNGDLLINAISMGVMIDDRPRRRMAGHSSPPRRPPPSRCCCCSPTPSPG